MRATEVDLGRLLEPASIAVVGASPDEKRFGGRPLHNLLLHGFPGRIVAVNPKYQEIRGVRCYPSLGAVDGTIDLALIAVPGEATLGAVADCAARSVRLAVVFGSGFAEAGPEGQEAQRELLRIGRSAGLRVMGPNCLGFLNVPARVAAAATGALDQPFLREGPISFVSQSGAMGFVSFFNRAYDAGVGFRYVAATGNEADLNAGQFIDHYVEDDKTRVVAALIEGFRDPAGLRRSAARAAELGKPVVVLKSGRSEEGARAAGAHTAAMAGSDAVHDAIFRSDGIVRVEEIDELWQVANLLARCSLPAGRRVAVISSSGGFNGILADHLRANGLTLPRLSEETILRLGQILPPYAYLGNPIDVTGQFAGRPDEAGTFIEVLRAIDRDPQIDTIVLVQIVVRREFHHVIEPILQAVKGLGKPTILVAPGGGISTEGLRGATELGVPIFDTARSTARALGLVASYAEWRRRHERRSPSASRSTPRPGARIGPGPQTFADTISLLSQFGIRMTDHRLTRDVHAARSAAERIGYPVVVKSVGTALLHKSDVGAVRTSVGPEQMDAAFEQVARVGRAVGGAAGYDGVLVQRQVQGVEVIVGIHQDPQFGPILALGAGGVLAELIDDVVLSPIPVRLAEARSLIGGLRVGRLLEGFRGTPPADVGSLARLITQVSDLAVAHGEDLAALDLNPVIVGPVGAGAAVVDALVIGSDPRQGSPVDAQRAKDE